MTVDLDLASLAPGLERREPGIWFARRQSVVSYPPRGNAACLEIEDRSFWFLHRNRCIVSLVRRFAPDGPFLDIGGGNGYVARGLVAAGISCALLEPGVDGALAAHARGIDPVICATLEDIDLPPWSIAAAGLFDVLEHIEDDVAALRRVHTLLRPGGRLVLTVPAYPLLYSADDAVAGHFRRYTRTTLLSALHASGFQSEFEVLLICTAAAAHLPPANGTAPTLGIRRSAHTEDIAAEHRPRRLAARIMDRMLAAEYKRINLGLTLSIGASCVCVAVKN